MLTGLFGLVLALFVYVHQPVESPKAVVPPVARFEPVPAPPVARYELVVLLPGKDGRAGMIVVEREGHRVVLDQPYEASRIEGDAMPRTEQLTAEQARAEFKEILTALPQPPASYLLYFVAGSDALTAESQIALSRMMEELRERPAPDIVLIGHTDTVGAMESNDALSLQRAERVRHHLVAHGIPVERIRAAGRGKRQLLVPTDDHVDEPRNRRVEITVR